MKSFPFGNRGKAAAILAVLAFGVSYPLRADVLLLQSGVVVTGKVLQ